MCLLLLLTICSITLVENSMVIVRYDVDDLKSRIYNDYVTKD